MSRFRNLLYFRVCSIYICFSLLIVMVANMMYLQQRSYTELLTKFREDFEEPYNKMMQFMDNATKDLEDICGHYVDGKSNTVKIGFYAYKCCT